MSANHSKHYRKLEHMYLSARCNEYYQPEIKIADKSAEVIIPVGDKMFHAGGAVHGSVYFKALDDAAYFSANSIVMDAFVLTANFNIYLTRPISKGHMKAIGTVVHATRSQIIAEAALYDEKYRLIAKGSGTYVKSRADLTEEMGYK